MIHISQSNICSDNTQFGSTHGVRNPHPCILLGLAFLLYCRYGRYAPSIFMHRGYSLERIVQHLYLTTEGVFGVAVGVSSTFIFLFILFGAFLSSK